MKRCLTPLDIREIQTKPQWNIILSILEWLKLKVQCLQGLGVNRNFHIATGVWNHCGKSLWEGGSRGTGYISTHNWFTLLYSKSQHNTVKQLSSN